MSSSIFCAKIYTIICLGAPGAPGIGWPRKKKESFLFLPTLNDDQGTSINMKVCDWSGHIFGASASPRSLTKKMAIHRLPLLLMAVSMIPNTRYVTFELIKHAALVADERGFMVEPARGFVFSLFLFCLSYCLSHHLSPGEDTTATRWGRTTVFLL